VVDLRRLTRLACHTRLWVGLSGGLDSMVLLHALSCEPTLVSKLRAVHVHHGLSPEADAWQAHCEQVCAALAIPITVKHVRLDNQQSNLEEAARDARFEVFEACIQPNDCLVLAHHQDDQAETLVLRLLRGAGVDGLASMKTYRAFGCGYITRPLLDTRKHKLEAYAKTHALVWVDDESNQDLKFSRNYLRHEIIPRLQQAWPRAVESISACAEHCQEAQANLDDLAYLDCPELALKQDELSLDVLSDLPLRRLKHVLRVWFKNQEIKALSAVKLDVLIQEVVFAKPDAMPMLCIGGMTVRRYRNKLYLVRDLKPTPPDLRIPTGAALDIRFRTGGETLVLHGQTKSLKSLFQIWGIPPWERDTIPLIFIENKLAAVLDFAIGDDYHEVSIDGQYNLQYRLKGACVDDIV
jgi:tRNA(Ile)-lysidine synthase